MITKNYKKTIHRLTFTDFKETVLVCWKEVVNEEIVNRHKLMKAGIALNFIENINKIAFISLETV